MAKFLGWLVFLPLFFYKLGQSSLVSWDEAWYAEVSRNILKRGDLFNLWYNGLPFSDKPPGGFWLEALSFKLFGVSEFSARLPSAVLGFLSLYLVYLLGAKLFNKLTGILSALALVSSYWFLARARLGDLDILLVFFYLLTVFLAFKTIENKKFLIPFSLSLAFLPMIKGIVFVPAILPSLVLIFWGNKKLNLKDYLIPLLFLGGLFGSWIWVQYLYSPKLATYHFYHSFRQSSLESNLFDNFYKFKEYLHNGIGKWFWPGVLGTFLSLFLKNKRLWVFLLFVFFYSLQFMFSKESEIWHLIPLYPFMILLFFGSTFLISKKIPQRKAVISLLLVLTLYISFIQIKRMWYEFINIPSFISDDAILSKEAGKYPYPFYIDSSFEPAAAFYSEKQVSWVNEFRLADLFKSKTPFLMIIKQPMLDKLGINKDNYQVLKSDRDKILILYRQS